MKKPWYQRSYFRNLVDMHISGCKEGLLSSFDPEGYAEKLAHAGFDTAYIYASNCLGLSLYPTKIGFRHPEAEKRDLFGETVAACQARGIRTVGYLNNWSTAAYDAFPAWRVVDANGKGYRDHPGHAGRYGVLCPNSPYRDRFLKQVRELCEGYPIAGLWVDMVGFWRGACYCESCKRKYREETGEEIPRTVDWSKRAWHRYLRFKEASIASFARDIVLAARAAREGITVSIQSAGWSLGHFLGLSESFFSSFDYAAGDFYGDVRAGAVDCKLLRAVSKNAPFEYMTSRCPNLTHHTVSRPLHELRAQAFAAVLHGGAFLAIDAIDPEGTMDPHVYDSFRAVKNAISSYAAHPAFLEGEPLAPVAVYVNFASAFDPRTSGGEAGSLGGAVPPLFERLRHIHSTLSREHIEYEIVTKQQLFSLSRYSVVLLSELYVLDDEECAALRDYVAGGGCLYVSGRSGTYFPVEEAAFDSLLRADFALSEVMGVSLDGTLPYDTCYIQPTESAAFYEEERVAHPLGMGAKGSPRIRAKEDTHILAKATLPYSNHSDGRRFISAISDPPWERTEIPVITEHTYGKGKCIYSSLLLEESKTEPIADFWLSLLTEAIAARPAVRIDAPPCFESSARRTKEGILISLLNILYHETGGGVTAEIQIAIPHALCDAVSVEVFPKGKVRFRTAKDETQITLSGLAELSFITVKRK